MNSILIISEDQSSHICEVIHFDILRVAYRYFQRSEIAEMRICTDDCCQSSSDVRNSGHRAKHGFYDTPVVRRLNISSWPDVTCYPRGI